MTWPTRRWKSSWNWPDPYERQVILVAKVDGDIVGTADIALPLADDLDLAEFTLDILPEFQHQGVGRQLLEVAEQFARGRRPDHDPDRHQPSGRLTEQRGRPKQLVPGSGLGFVPRESREVEFARKTGYTLQHIEQFSSCLLPLDTKLVAELADGSRTGQCGTLPPASLDGQMPGPVARRRRHAGKPGRRGHRTVLTDARRRNGVRRRHDQES